MTSIHTVLGGGAIASGSVYNVDRDFNSLATVLLLPSVAVFGDSTFALRLTPFLATCATLILVYLFGSLLFKDEKYGFVFALLFAVGGLATTVGRLGAPYALLACFLVASAYLRSRGLGDVYKRQDFVRACRQGRTERSLFGAVCGFGPCDEFPFDLPRRRNPRVVRLRHAPSEAGV